MDDAECIPAAAKQYAAAQPRSTRPLKGRSASPFPMPLLRLTCTVFAALLALAPLAAAQRATVSGYVRDADSGETLLSATVQVEGTAVGTVTNTSGFYTLGLPAGEVQLLFSYVGYQPQRVTLTLTEGETERLDIELAEEVLEGEEIVVEGVAPLEEEKAVGLQQVSIQLVQQIPSAFEADLFRSIQLLPGVKAASDFSSALYIRGGSPDQTLILLDGTTVYNPTHFFGFFSTFNTDAIKDVRLFKGGYPAEYGGRLGAVIDIYNRDGNRNSYHGGATLGLLASRVDVEGPLNLGGKRGSFMLAGRRSTLEPLLAVLRESEDNIPDTFYFYDFNAKVNVDLGPSDRLAVAGYAGTDLVKFPFAEDANFTLNYGNLTGSVLYTHLFSQKVFSTLRVTGSRYFNFPKGEIAATEFSRRNTVTDISAKGDLEWLPSPEFTAKVGFWGGELRFNLEDEFNGQQTLDSRIRADYLQAYVQGTWKPSPLWKVTGGLRAPYFSNGSYLRLEPRLQVERIWNDRLVLQAAYGRYYQFLSLVTNEAFSGFDVWVTTTDGVPPAYGDQVSLGLKSRPLPNWGLDVEGYYRSMNDLFEFDPELPDIAGLDYSEIFRFGKGRAYGIETMLEKRAGRLSGFLSYTLAWTERKFVNANGEPVNPGLTVDSFGVPRFYSPKYDRRNDVTLVANYALGRGWVATSAFSYATGQAYTNPNGYAVVDESIIPGGNSPAFVTSPSLNNARLDPYHRLDLGVTKTGGFFGVGDYELRLQVINVYNRRNIWFFLQEDVEEGEPLTFTAVRMLPILPNVSFTLDF
jgi:hypothetical protein